MEVRLEADDEKVMGIHNGLSNLFYTDMDLGFKGRKRPWLSRVYKWWSVVFHYFLLMFI